MEEQTIVFTFGGVDVVSQPYLLATSTQASLLGGVRVEQVIEEEGTVLHGRREEGTETCDYLCDELVAIVARLDPHKPANTQISTVHPLSQVCCYLDDDGSQQCFLSLVFLVMTHFGLWLKLVKYGSTRDD